MTKLYTSIFSQSTVDSSNHLVELMFKKKADKEKVNLPQHFWLLPKYKNLYIREISQARILLKKYDERAIAAAINQWDSRHIMSLRNKNLIPIIEREQSKLKETEFVPIESELPRTQAKPFGRNKLGEL